MTPLKSFAETCTPLAFAEPSRRQTNAGVRKERVPALTELMAAVSD